MPESPTMAPVDWLLLLFLSVLWGGSFFFVNVIVRDLPPLTLVLARFTIASAALWCYLRLCRVVIPWSFIAWANFAGMGALNNLIPAALIAWSQTEIASGLASILVATTPIFSILAAHFLTDDERIAANKVAGIGLGFAGVLILVGASSLHGSERSLSGTLACLAAALSYGLANVFGRRFRRMEISPAAGAFGQITATAAMVLPLALVTDLPWRLRSPHAHVWLALLGLALVSTALAYVIFFRILGRAGGTNISLVTLLIPVSAILLGWLVLGERLHPVQSAGMALIGAGLIAIDGHAWRIGWIRNCAGPISSTGRGR